MIDKGLRGHVLWVAGPAGSGKTALVGNYITAGRRRVLWYRVDAGDVDLASFFHYLQLAADEHARRNRKRPVRLVPEYLLNPAAFSQRFFENFYEMLAPGTCLVFDNMQAVPAESAFHEVLAESLAHLPQGMNAILISRGDPPPAFARFRVSNPGWLLGWKDLRLTHAEAEAMARKRWGKKARPESVRYLHARSDGWVAGLVLLLEKATAADAEPQTLSRHSPEDIFEYFGGEVFARLDEETRHFLMTTAFLPDMTATAAEALSGSAKAGQILAHLYSHGYFTEKHLGADAVYRYHALFREFLLNRAEMTLPHDALSSVRRRAAAILEGSGRVEEAAALCVAGADWEALGRLIQVSGRSLARQGRASTLQEWLLAVPQEVRDADPWLLYWTGVCELPQATAAARSCFERAFEIFESGGNVEGALVSWNGAVESILLEWDDFTLFDRWIDWLDRRLAEGLSFPSVEIEARVATGMTAAMLFRRPKMSEVGRWAERSLALSRDLSDGDFKLQAWTFAGMYHFWAGDRVRTTLLVADGRRLAEYGRVHPARYIAWKWLEATVNLCGGADRDVARQSLAEGLKAARQSGVRVWDHLLHALTAIAFLMEGDLAGAERSLGEMESTLAPTRRHADAMHQYLCAWLYLLRGDAARAAAHAERALTHAVETGMVFLQATCRLAVANIEVDRGRHGDAALRVSEAWDLIRGIGSLPLEYMAHLTEARIAPDGATEEAGLESLRAGMALGREHGYLNTFWWWQPRAMTRLCETALAARIEPDYVRRLIVGNGLAPEVPPMEVEEWPWPLRVFTLGRFELVIGGKAFQSPGKVQQKPLQLLKALIALGGRGVPEQQLVDVLWPDVDGDLAHQSFATTLRRLRQLLGNEKAVLLRDGRLTLNNRYCWVDAWAFERLLGQAESGWKEGAAGKGSARLVERAIALYQGPFLAGETFCTRLVSLRERLRSKFLRCVEAAGRDCENSGDLKRAVAFYRKGLEVDDLAEEFYQCLISCYRNLGMNAEAVRAYRRCRKTLSSVLGVKPSPGIEELAKSLKIVEL